jgi:anti-sigma B factor antagonist
VQPRSRDEFFCRVRTFFNATLITVAGQVDLRTAPELEKCVTFPEMTTPLVVFDLGDVTFFGVAGVHVLLRARDACRARGAHMAVTSSPVVANAMELAGVTDMFARRQQKRRAGAPGVRA